MPNFNNADNHIDLNRIWTMKSLGGKESITLGFYGRKASLTVFSSEENNTNRRPVAKIDVSVGRALFMIDCINRVMKADKPTRILMGTNTWDPSQKKFVAGTTVGFFRDDKQRIGFDLIKDSENTYRFIFDTNRDTRDGGEELSESVRSSYGARVFAEVVLKQQLPVAYLLCGMNPAPQYNRNNRGGNSSGSSFSNSERSSSSYDGGDSSTAVWEN